MQVVGPKKIKLAEAEEELNKTMAMLNAKRAELAAVEKRLADLKATFQEMTEKKAKLEMQVSQRWQVARQARRLPLKEMSQCEDQCNAIILISVRLNAGTVSKATLGKLQKDVVECTWAFPNP